MWTGVCLTFVFGALLEFALVNYASRSDQHRENVKKQRRQWELEQAAALEAAAAVAAADRMEEGTAVFGMHRQHSFTPVKDNSVPQKLEKVFESMCSFFRNQCLQRDMPEKRCLWIKRVSVRFTWRWRLKEKVVLGHGYQNSRRGQKE